MEDIDTIFKRNNNYVKLATHIIDSMKEKSFETDEEKIILGTYIINQVLAMWVLEASYGEPWTTQAGPDRGLLPKED